MLDCVYLRLHVVFPARCRKCGKLVWIRRTYRGLYSTYLGFGCPAWGYDDVCRQCAPTREDAIRILQG